MTGQKIKKKENNVKHLKKKIHVAKPLPKTIKISEKMDINQARLFIGFHAPPMDHPAQLAVKVFEEILGNGLSPLLSSAIVQRGRRLVYGITTSYIPLKFGGAFLVFLVVETKHLKTVQRQVMKFFNKTAWNYKYALEDYPVNLQLHVTDHLEKAKNSLKFSHQEFQELGMNSAIAYARYILLFDDQKKEKKRLSYMEKLEKVK